MGEAYLQDIERAAWREELAQQVQQRDREVQGDRMDSVKHLREVRNSQKAQERFEVDENRHLEQSLELAHMARELAKEKDALMQSLEYTRACQRASLSGRISGASFGAY